MIKCLLSLWIGLLAMGGFASAPVHPLPDGHINRDVQVTIKGRQVIVDVRLSASDVTWIELIAKSEERTKIQALATEETVDHRSKRSKPSVEKSSGATESQDGATESQDGEPEAAGTTEAKKEQAGPEPQPDGPLAKQTVDTPEIDPLPQTEDEVSQWLIVEDNRVLLERWVASHTQLSWDQQSVPMIKPAVSRQNGRHHWSISVEMEFQLPEEPKAGAFLLVEDAFEKYPGQVRRALKARGTASILESAVEAAIVRAPWEAKTEDSEIADRRERIQTRVSLE